ncbi:30S ribosome-binding factor RbfA [Yunchengibacter salinarum]|uniref:30S ribosome-binding factor RbfA n=1 Tax=Yunchengibacter salinarum TaxID=3133399 RepID=UPI0035B592E3
MSRSKGRGQPSTRLLRVGENVRHAISSILMRGDLTHPALEGASITVSEVRVSPDLRHATVFVMPLMGSDQAAVLDALNRLSGAIRGGVGRQVRMKYTPDLVFELDSSFDEASHIDTLLKDPHVAQDLAGDGNTDL